MLGWLSWGQQRPSGTESIPRGQQHPLGTAASPGGLVVLTLIWHPDAHGPLGLPIPLGPPPYLGTHSALRKGSSLAALPRGQAGPVAPAAPKETSRGKKKKKKTPKASSASHGSSRRRGFPPAEQDGALGASPFPAGAGAQRRMLLTQGLPKWFLFLRRGRQYLARGSKQMEVSG